jgi:hypothetical protein
MKTVRFAQVVARSGKPHPHAFWVAPERDKEFLAAQKADRVMTVAPLEPGKADVGTIGFDKARAKNGQVLIFPKSLRAFEGAHVVGIKFGAVDQPSLVAGEADEPKPSHPAHPRAGTGTASHGKHEPAPHVPSGDDTARERRRPPGRRRTESSERGISSDSRKERTGRQHSHGARSEKARPSLSHSKAESALVREVKAALAELKAGNTVAAYERLRRAIE